MPATTSALKKIITRVFERTGWEIKDVFVEEELADMIDAVVKEPPHMFVHFYETREHQVTPCRVQVHR